MLPQDFILIYKFNGSLGRYNPLSSDTYIYYKEHLDKERILLFVPYIKRSW